MNEIRYALRQMQRAPLFASIVIATLGIGIGGTTAMFCFVHGVLIQPLPYPEPDRLVMLCETHPEMDPSFCPGSPANWQDWRATSKTVETSGLARSWQFGIERDGRSHGTSGGIATPGLFQTLAVEPVMGRVFEDRDIVAGNERVALVSHGFWQSWYGGRDVLGRQLDLDGAAYEVIGVLPAGFEVPWLAAVEVWIPLWPERLAQRDWRGFWSFGRLADGVSLGQARAELEAVRAGLAEVHPETNEAWGLVVDSLHDRKVRSVRRELLALQLAVGLVLLIACGNVAHLFLARASSRERELGVRAALGAGRGRLFRQHLIESLAYSIPGGIVGILFAYWARDIFISLAPSWFPRLAEVTIDLKVLAFAMVTAVLTSLLFGLAPALQASRMSAGEALKDGRSPGQNRRARRIRDALVVAEIALACVLLVGAGLVLRSFGNLLGWDPGFERQGLLVVQAFSPQAKYTSAAQTTGLFERTVEALASVPGVTSVGATSSVPLWGGDGEQEFLIEGRPAPPPGERPSVAWFDVFPTYFSTLGLPLKRGRPFDERDSRNAPKVAIINETMAERFWPGEDPIGQRLHLAAHQTTVEIVGVVGDIQPFRPDEATGPQIFWPFAQFPRGAVQFVMRTSVPPSQIVRTARNRITEIEPDMSLSTMRTMEDLINRQLVDHRFTTALFAIFAAVAALMAATGIYGVMAFNVAQRTHEIGVRVALGADRRRILGLVLSRGARLCLAGVGLGLFGAVGVTRLLESLLVQVTPQDPSTLAGVATLFVFVTLAACYVPARRAISIDPLTTLRHE